MRIGVLLVFGTVCLFGILTDVLASVFGLIAWMNADHWVAKLLILGFGVIVTFSLAGTKYVIARKVPGIISLLWMCCALIDIYTTVIGSMHFLVAEGDLKGPVIVSPEELIAVFQQSPARGVLALSLTTVVTVATISGPYCLERADSELETPPDSAAGE